MGSIVSKLFLIFVIFTWSVSLHSHGRSGLHHVYRNILRCASMYFYKGVFTISFVIIRNCERMAKPVIMPFQKIAPEHSPTHIPQQSGIALCHHHTSSPYM